MVGRMFRFQKVLILNLHQLIKSGSYALFKRRQRNFSGRDAKSSSVKGDHHFEIQLRKGNFINYTPYELAMVAKEGAKKALQDLDRVKVWGDTH